MAGSDSVTTSAANIYSLPGEDLPSLLKQATRPVHEQVERELGLGAPGVGVERYRTILEGFYGLHAVWEPAAHHTVSCPELTTGRIKLPKLAHDLQALGMLPEQVRRWPGDPSLRSAAAGLGAMYVMEGATLGGQVIARTLDADPAFRGSGAYTFFQSYGGDAGRMWREFVEHLRTKVASHDQPDVVEAAVRTFQSFRDWLVERRA